MKYYYVKTVKFFMGIDGLKTNCFLVRVDANEENPEECAKTLIKNWLGNISFSIKEATIEDVVSNFEFTGNVIDLAAE